MPVKRRSSHHAGLDRTASVNRFGPGAHQAGDKYLLVDAGRVVTQRLWQLRIPLGRIDGLFVTHLHSDHVMAFQMSC